MVSAFEKLKANLMQNPKYWLITGVAGFIGSNLLEFLLRLDQKVIGLDNFSTGFQHNLDEIKNSVTEQQWSNFALVTGDICSFETCKEACKKVDYVLHQAALGSVPRSIDTPLITNASNIDGFLNMLVAAKDAQVKGFVYAASSSTYGDHPDLPKVEDKIGKPLSPYALTKLVNELYAEVFDKTYGFKTIGLRYFNVFGPRQDPNGAYAAVIPKWIRQMLNNDPVTINGNGETSRDFCYIDNTIQANILAACAEDSAKNQIYNVALNERTSLNQLFIFLKETLKIQGVDYQLQPLHGAFRLGDVFHSQADISKIKTYLGYEPQYRIQTGIEKAMPWYIRQHMTAEIFTD